MPAKKKQNVQPAVALAEDSNLLSFAQVLQDIEQKRIVRDNVASVLVPWQLLRGSNTLQNTLQIRPVTTRHVDLLARSIAASGFFSSSTLLVRQQVVPANEEERERVRAAYGPSFVTNEGVWYYDIFDGNHRFQAVLRLIQQNQLPQSTLLGCILYKEDTPVSLCAEYANRINEIQHLAKAGSYVDMLVFVDKHCTSRLEEYMNSEEYKSITVARKKHTALKNFRKGLGATLRLKLISTLQAATGIVGGAVSVEEIARIEKQFTEAHVFSLIRLVGVLGRTGLAVLTGLQNINVSELQAARIKQLAWRVTTKMWVPEAKPSTGGISYGFPSTVRATMAIVRAMDQEKKMSDPPPNEEKLSEEEKTQEKQRKAQVTFDWLAMHVAFMAATLFTGGSIEQGQLVDGIFAFLRTPEGVKAKQLFFRDLAFIVRMQNEANGSPIPEFPQTYEKVFGVQFFFVLRECTKN